MQRCILALDQGTTSTRAILFGADGRAIARAYKPLTQYYPRPGWAEHDPLEIYASACGVMTEAIAQADIPPAAIAAVGIANQRETTVIWDKRTGRPIAPAIVWQCRRTAPIITALRDSFAAAGKADYIQDTTGLIPDAYFSGSKIAWLLDNISGARQDAEAGNLLFGTIDSWLLWKLTAACGEAIHATDETNASRTMLYNIRTHAWDAELLDALRIPPSMLPRVRPSAHRYGAANICGVSVPIAGIAGDQQAALFGQRCFSAGEAKITYGTGCFLLMNTGREALRSADGLLTTPACRLDGETDGQYALEGSVFAGGSVIQWLRDELRLITEAGDAEYYARKAGSAGGVYLVPAFTGLGSPWWDMNARGIIAGLTRGTKRAHIIRAAEESIAYQCCDLLRAMETGMGGPAAALKADGGASRDGFLMQFQADITGRAIRRPDESETTALGAAYLAGIASGVWEGREELRHLEQSGTDFEPAMEQRERETLLAGWHKAVERSLSWADSGAAGS